jgi:uncharacterized protein (TIGR02145 family)
MKTRNNNVNYLRLLTILLLVNSFSSCKKKPVVELKIETDSIMDIDSNIYKTVKIGNKWWMAENLKTRKYRNGELIRTIQFDEQWQKNLPAYSKYGNGSTVTGLLYNFFAISDTNGIAPNGWHVATDDDWKELEIYLGMTKVQADSTGWRGTNEGEKLKKEGNTGWSPFEDVWNTNSSGFTALSGSCRLPNATFGNPGLSYTGFWWCNTELNNNESYYRYMDYKSKKVMRHYVSKNYGMSVRCVKD